MNFRRILVGLILTGIGACANTVDPEDYNRSCSTASECGFTEIGPERCELMTFNLSEAERLSNDLNQIPGRSSLVCSYGPQEPGCYSGECVIVDGNCTEEAIEGEFCPLRPLNPFALD